MIVDGTDPNMVREILFHYTVCDRIRGKELIANVMIVEGITAIQQGLHTKIIKEILLSFLGAEAIEEAKKLFPLEYSGVRI